jgi:hypothetical protein
MSTALARYRTAAFIRQFGFCHYCGFAMWMDDLAEFCACYRLTPAHARRMCCTAEHLVARRDGGRDSAANIVAACLHCNRTRHRPKNVLDPLRYRQRVCARVQMGRWHNPAVMAAFRT